MNVGPPMLDAAAANAPVAKPARRSTLQFRRLSVGCVCVMPIITTTLNRSDAAFISFNCARFTIAGRTAPGFPQPAMSIRPPRRRRLRRRVRELATRFELTQPYSRS